MSIFPTVPSASRTPGMDPDLAFVDHEVTRRLFGGSRRDIGRYPVVGVLGSGGMGLVYLAADDRLQRHVAIKLLNSDSRTSEGVERLLREARAMARLSHPGVVQVYEAGLQSGQVFIVMEYIHGSTLSEWGNAPGRSWRDVREMFVAIGKGVSAAHAVGIIHRDLKPSNILIDAQDNPKVADFGLARKEAEEGTDLYGSTETDVSRARPQGLTVAGAQIGTPRYMSPEQHHGDTASVASDQYSFCLVMWEALYRQYPFAGDNEGQLRAVKAVGAVLAPPATARVPAKLRRALLRGLDPDPAKRWPSMPALVAELERDPWRRRLPWVMALAGILATLFMFAARHLMSEAPGQACTVAADARVAAVWNEDAQHALSQHFARAESDTGIAEALEVLAPELDRYAEQLKQARQTLCVLAAGPVVDPTLAAQDICLEHRLLAFSGYLAALRELAPASSTARATAAFFDPGLTARPLGPALALALRLPAVAACRFPNIPDSGDVAEFTPGASQIRAPVRARIAALARVQALETLGHEAAARTGLERLLPALRAEGPADLLPEHEYLHGRLLRGSGRTEEARDALYRAEYLAEWARRDHLLIAVRLELAMVAMEARATLDTRAQEAQPTTAGHDHARATAVLLRNGGDPTRDPEFMKVEAMMADHRGETHRGRLLRRRVSEQIAERFPTGVVGIQLLAQFANQYARAGLTDPAMELDLEVVQRAQDILGVDHLLTGDVAYNAALRLLRAPSASQHRHGRDNLELAMQVYRNAPGAALRHGMAEHAAASALLHAGESELAWPHAQRALTLVCEQPERLPLAFTLRLYGMIQLRRGNYDAAYRAAAEALHLLSGITATEEVQMWRWQIEVGMIEALVYQERGADALDLAVALRREIGRAQPTELRAELSLREAQAAYLLGQYAVVKRMLGDGGTGHLCDALPDRLATGDVHALIAQIRRARGYWQAADEQRDMAIGNYSQAGSDGRARQRTGTPWSQPMTTADGTPL